MISIASDEPQSLFFASSSKGRRRKSYERASPFSPANSLPLQHCRKCWGRRAMGLIDDDAISTAEPFVSRIVDASLKLADSGNHYLGSGIFVGFVCCPKSIYT